MKNLKPIRIDVTEECKKALSEWAADEMRPLKNHIEYLVNEAAERWKKGKSAQPH